MLIWNLIFLISFFLIYAQCKPEKLDNIILQYNEDNNNIIEITPETIQTEFLNNNEAKTLKFSNIEDKSKNLLIHLFSINCEIEINSSENDITKNIYQNNDAFLIKINFEKNNNIIIKPLINSKNKNIKNKTCPLIINSIFDDVYELKVEEQNPTIFYFNDQLTNISLFYNITDFTKDKSFVLFQFLFNEKATFEIIIDEMKTNQRNQKRIISNSHNVFLTEDSIKELEKFDNILKINLRLVNYTNPFPVYFRVISNKFTPLILQKNYLNHAFITSDLKYQHYFMEISKGEEGEVMLHDKRQNGKLIGKICNKTDIQCIEFENETIANNYLYKEHIRKLNFTYEETDYCNGSCILLITYYHNTFDKIDDTIIGFEFTLLSRIWEKNDWSDTNIVTIPNNEYIFGYFDKDIINHHYYSIPLSNEINRICIEIRGSDIEFFYDEGKRKLNTYNSKITNKFNIDGASMQNILVEKYKGKYLSFTIRPTDFLKHPTTFYYFRVFQLREKDNLIIPLDSNVESICTLPDKSVTNCNFLLTNNYNEFKLAFSLFANNKQIIYNSFNSNKLQILNMQDDSMNKLIDELYKNNTRIRQNAIYCNNDNNLNYILFKFFLYEKQMTIQNTFYDRKEEIYPQVYSPQIFKIEANTRIKYTFLSNMNFNLIANWVHGEGEVVNFGSENLEMDVNYMGRPYSILISEIKDTINFKSTRDFVLYLGLKYNANKNFILEEITEYQISNIIQNKAFPFYYYIRTNLNESDSMDINLKILDFREMLKNITIEQMFCDEDTLNSLKQGKNLKFETKNKGHYDISSKSGLIQIKNDGKEENITLIKIDGPDDQLNKRILVQIIVLIIQPKKHPDTFYLNSCVPVNQFIAGSIIKNKNSATYVLNSNSEEITEKIIIEFSKNNPGLELDLLTSKTINYNVKDGIETFIIDRSDFITVQFNQSRTPENYTEGNYMFRYYYNTTKFLYYDYEFNKLCNITKKNDSEQNNIVQILFTFEKLKIINNNESLLEYNIYLSLYPNENSDEIFNTISFNSIKPVAQNMVKSNSSEDNFTVEIDIDRTDLNNYKFIMQIKFYLISYSVNYKILTYSMPMDLTQYLKREDTKGTRDNKRDKLILILSIISGTLVIIVIIVVIYIIKMKNKNKDLKDKVLSISFTSGQSDSILSDNSNYSKKDEEYENTFI